MIFKPVKILNESYTFECTNTYKKFFNQPNRKCRLSVSDLKLLFILLIDDKLLLQAKMMIFFPPLSTTTTSIATFSSSNEDFVSGTVQYSLLVSLSHIGSGVSWTIFFFHLATTKQQLFVPEKQNNEHLQFLFSRRVVSSAAFFSM